MKATIHTRMVTDRYGTQSLLSKFSGPTGDPTCLTCTSSETQHSGNTPVETLEHLLFECVDLAISRREAFSYAGQQLAGNTYLTKWDKALAQEVFVQAVPDPASMSLPPEVKISRNANKGAAIMFRQEK